MGQQGCVEIYESPSDRRFFGYEKCLVCEEKETEKLIRISIDYGHSRMIGGHQGIGAHLCKMCMIKWKNGDTEIIKSIAKNK